MVKKEVIKFWKSSTSGSERNNLKKDFSTLRDGAFFTIWLYLRREWSNFHENFATDVFLDKKVPVNFWR